MIAQQFYKKEMIFMPAYKDEKTGKWFAKFYYTNWQGIKKQKWKRGFATKKEALGFERDFLEKQSANPDMTFQNLYEIYMEDMAARLKQSTLTIFDTLAFKNRGSLFDSCFIAIEGLSVDANNFSAH